MKTEANKKITMEIVMDNTKIREMPIMLRLIATDIENGINRRVYRFVDDTNKKYSFETTLSPTHLVSKF